MLVDCEPLEDIATGDETEGRSRRRTPRLTIDSRRTDARVPGDES